MKTDCNHCAPGIDCIHIGHGTGPQACPWYKRGDPTALPRGSVMELTITNCDAEGVIDARMCLRLVMHYTKEAGVIYENWASPDFPLPQPMISEILTFLEDHVCGTVDGIDAGREFFRGLELGRVYLLSSQGCSPREWPSGR